MLEPRTKQSTGKISPADRLISDLEGDYLKLSEVAKICKVSQVTLRRLLNHPDIKAPSFQIKRGKMVVYLYTTDDVEELKRHFNASKVPVERS